MKKLLFLLVIITSFCYSQEEKRLALVIGNANYDKGALKNPVNDAKLIAKALDSLGFEVLEHYNLNTQRELKKAILEFGVKRDSANVGFVYYAGHGVQVNNENYLLPTEEIYTTQTEVIEYAVSVQSVLRALKSKSSQVNILVLDACRDNPFESEWNTTRSLKGDGLAKIPPPTGSLIAFSTDAGQTAADGKDENSVYTLSLFKNMLLEDTSLDQVFRNVRTDVLKLTNGNQRPVEMTQLTGQTFYLNPGNYDDEFKAIEGILEEKTELTDALNILAPIINDRPKNIRALHLNAQTYVALENFSKALAVYEKVIELNPTNSLYLIEKASCYAKLEDLEKAIEDYNKAVEVAPSNSFYYEMRGDFYQNYLKDYEKALADYNTGIELNPTDPDLHFSKAYVYNQYLDKPALALESYLEVARLNPEDQNVNNNIALIYENSIKDYQKALEYYTKGIEFDPSDAIAYGNRADLYASQLEDLEKALEDYNKAVEVAPSNSFYYEMRGRFYEGYLEDYEKALADYNTGIELNPTDSDLHFRKAYVYNQYLENPDLALETLLNLLNFDAIEKILDNSYLNTEIADIYLFKFKDLEKSFLFYKKEVKRSPESYYGYLKLAEYYFFSKNNKLAEFNYKKALELNPENNNLNLSFINYKYLNKNYEEVIKLSKKVIKKEPKDPQGDYLTALSYLKIDHSMKALISLSSSIDKIIKYSAEGFYISDTGGKKLDFSEVFMKRAQVYKKYNEFELMCEDYNLALAFVKDEDLKIEIENKISTNCNN
jgi:tetratricopeptide (TPR) repeat protein